MRTRIGFGLVALAALAASLPSILPANAASTTPVIHFVVDVSGSMAGERLSSAVAAIKDTAAAVPDSTALGLRSYADSCDQSGVQAVVPIAAGNDAGIDAAADALVAGGGTPTTAALGRGFDDLAAFDTTGSRRLVLLTDGDTQCGVSICDYVKQNLPAGLQLTMYTVGLAVTDAAAADLTCAAEYTGGSYIPATSPGDLAAALQQAAGGGQACAGSGAGGWKFRAHVSDNDGLVLDESSFEGRVFSKAMSVPYLDGLWTDDTSRNPRLRHVRRLELTADPAKANTVRIGGQAIVGSSLLKLECVGSGSDDIYARATYAVNDFVYGGKAPSYLTVTQEYRFRGIDAAHPCEPSEKLSCARFWPSLKYAYAGPTACAGQAGRPVRCGPMFAGVRTVQRMEFRPDDAANGAIDAYYDRNKIESVNGVSNLVVDTKGSHGSMKYEDVDEAIVGGRRGDWDSIHQSPRSATTGPNPFKFTPGCGECVHMHWAWGKTVNALNRLVNHLDPLSPNWTDGRPEILDRSTQDADFGIVRLVDSPSERDPAVLAGGWRSLIDRKGSAASQLRGYTPVVFWEMASTGASDAAFPILDNYKHGGNGAIFFGG